MGAGVGGEGALQGGWRRYPIGCGLVGSRVRLSGHSPAFPDLANPVGDLFRREMVRIDLVSSSGRVLRDPAIEDLLDLVGEALRSRQ